MDQSLSLPACPSLTPPDPAAPPAAATPAAAATEEPDSPGRSPRPGTDLLAAATGESAETGETISPDPLAEGLGLLAGMAIALITLVVPLATVLCDPAAPPAALPPRAAAL